MSLEIVPTPGAVVTVARPPVLRLQRAIALSVVVVPVLGAIVAVWLGARNGIGATEIVSLAVMYLLCMLGITAGFHRLFAHRSYNTGRVLKALLAAAGSMAGQGPILFWVATHRRHHAHSDRDGDPHSPNRHGDRRRDVVRGLWHAHIQWMFARELADVGHYARDVLRDRTLFWFHRTYLLWVLIGLVAPAAVCAAVTGSGYDAWMGFLWGGLVRMLLVNQASWCVGSICHRFGSRPFATEDNSANNYPVAVIAFGEGLQNNHHAFPGSYRHAVRWWQPDLSAWVIRSLAGLGLAWGLREPSARDVASARRTSRSPYRREEDT